MKLLRFETKRNLKSAPRIHVRSTAKNICYGSFRADKPEEFQGWEQMSQAEIIEVKLYMQNLDAVKSYLGTTLLDSQTDYRLRLPQQFADAAEQISLLCVEEEIDINIYRSIILSVIQELKIYTNKLSNDSKAKALTILDKLNLAEYNKVDYKQKTQAIFSELLPLCKKADKLKHKAELLFDKQKNYSRYAINNMAIGEVVPSKWLTACAIVILIEEKPIVLKNMLSEGDLFVLFAKQMIDNDKTDQLRELVKQHHLTFLEEKIVHYLDKKSQD